MCIRDRYYDCVEWISNAGCAKDIIGYCLPKYGQPFGIRIVRLASRDGVLNQLREFFWNREIARIEITDREIHDRLASREHRSHLTRYSKDARLLQPAHHRGQGRVERFLVSEIESTDLIFHAGF